MFVRSRICLLRRLWCSAKHWSSEHALIALLPNLDRGDAVRQAWILGAVSGLTLRLRV